MNYLQAAFIVSKLGIEGLDAGWFTKFQKEFCEDLKASRFDKYNKATEKGKAYWDPRLTFFSQPAEVNQIFTVVGGEPAQKQLSAYLTYLQRQAKCTDSRSSNNLGEF